MTKPWLDWLGWCSGLVVLGGLLLAAPAEVQRRTIPTPAVRERLGGLVACVVPAGTDDPSSSATTRSETSVSDCESSVSDRLYAPRMTAC